MQESGIIDRQKSGGKIILEREYATAHTQKYVRCLHRIYEAKQTNLSGIRNYCDKLLANTTQGKIAITKMFRTKLV